MRAIVLPLIVVLTAGAFGLWYLMHEPEADVVLYCAVDTDQSRPIADEFAQQSGLRVRYEGEIETMRSVGLSQKLLLEKDEPLADVFWNNEIMTTAYLANRGLLDALPPGAGEGFPAEWRDPNGKWIAFGARARILLVNKKLLPDRKDWPDSVEDLLDPKYAEMGLKTCMARPETGTTYTHAVALLVKDPDGAKRFFQAVGAAAEKGTLRLVPGNGPSMDQARDASNKVAFSLTDTDDAWLAVREGAEVEVVYPDQAEGRPGTMIIPNTVALVKGRPHPGKGPNDLVTWLTSAETEKRLAEGPSAQMPLRPGVPAPAHVKRPGTDFRAMTVDWPAVAKDRDTWRDWLQTVFRPAR